MSFIKTPGGVHLTHGGVFYQALGRRGGRAVGPGPRLRGGLRTEVPALSRASRPQNGCTASRLTSTFPRSRGRGRRSGGGRGRALRKNGDRLAEGRENVPETPPTLALTRPPVVTSAAGGAGKPRFLRKFCAPQGEGGAGADAEPLGLSGF